MYLLANGLQEINVYYPACFKEKRREKRGWEERRGREVRGQTRPRLTFPSFDVPATCPVAIVILSGWTARLEKAHGKPISTTVRGTQRRGVLGTLGWKVQ